MKLRSAALKNRHEMQSGINMVDLMMWLVIAALLLAAAIQSIGYFQQTAYVYQMKTALDVAAGRVAASATTDGSIDGDDADTVVAAVNAETPNDNITLSVETVTATAAAEPGSNYSGMELASAVTATTVGSGQVVYLRATHTLVTGKDAVYFFKNTATQSAGVHLVGKGTNGTGVAGTASPVDGSGTTPTPTPTPTPTSSPTASATTSPALTVLSITEQLNSPNLNYYDVALSADGTKMIAGSNVGYIYRSTDSGATWNPLNAAGSRGWYGLASNGDGTKLIGTTNTGYVYISNDSGASWSQTTLPSKPWADIAMTPDGTKIIAGVTSSGNLYVSTDGGTNWTVQKGTDGNPLTSDFRSVALTDDGSTMIAASISYANLWISRDGGTTWQGTAPYYSGKYYGAAISADGKTIATGRLGGGLVISKDSGATWTIPGGVNSDNFHVSMSGDGTKIAATGSQNSSTSNPNAVYVSKDSGDTFAQQSQVGTAQWWNSAISRDGSTLVFGSINGKHLWTGKWTAQ